VLGGGFSLRLSFGKIDERSGESAKVGWTVTNCSNADVAFAVVKCSGHGCTSFLLIDYVSVFTSAWTAETWVWLQQRPDWSRRLPDDTHG
jgi:hypothetical protein